MADLTLTKEDLFELLHDLICDNSLGIDTEDKVRAAIALALVGLAVQPRPIEEAPKDGTRILALWGGEWVVTYWTERPGFKGWKMPSGMVVKAYDRSAWQPIQFTALPEPKQ